MLTTFPLLHPYCAVNALVMNLHFLHGVHRRNVDYPSPINSCIPSSVYQIFRGAKEGPAEIQKGDILIRSLSETWVSHDLLFSSIVNRGIDQRQTDDASKVQREVFGEPRG